MKKQTQITLTQAVSGFLLSIRGRRLSENTVRDYSNTLGKFQEFMQNPLVREITSEDISAFLASQDVSKKTASNYHSCLSSMFRWLFQQGMVDGNIVSLVDRPRPEKRVIDPLSEDEVRRLMAAVAQSKPYSRPGKRTSSHTIFNADRNRAILMFFLDNGVRVSELANIKIADLDVKQNRCFIFGKGAKERYVPFSPRTGQVLWRYITIRGEVEQDDYLFVTRQGRKLDSRNIERILESMEKRAGTSHVHPHRLRHTFAITYLRAGGDIFTLQAILGHEELDMVRRYSCIAQTDITRAHRRSSPVEFLRL